MDKLLSYFRLSASVEPGDTKTLVVSLVIYLAACGIMGILGKVLGWIPILGWLLGIVFSLAGLYCVVGMVLSVLQYLKK